jgi:hypothetical protein
MTTFGLNGAIELFDHCSHNDLLNVHQNSLCVLEDCDQKQHLLFVHSIASASAKDSEANACMPVAEGVNWRMRLKFKAMRMKKCVPNGLIYDSADWAG